MVSVFIALDYCDILKNKFKLKNKTIILVPTGFFINLQKKIHETNQHP